MPFRHHVPFMAALGGGLFVGISGIIMYLRLTNKLVRELQRLSGNIIELQSEVSSLKEKLEAFTAAPRKRSKGGFITASSGDEEDVYEEAYGGGSDVDTLKELYRADEQEPSTSSKAQTDKESIFVEVDKLFDGSDEDKIKAFGILHNNRTKFLTDSEFFWRLSKCTFLMSQIEGARGKPDKKKEYIYAAKDVAHTAIRLDDNCANAHKWFAISVGSVGEYESTQQKIKNGFLYKVHIEKAISLKPSDPSNHHLLGRWCFGVYMLSWLERKAAAALYATPPSSTAEEALEHFLEADRLNPGKWKENILYIAKCYIEIRQYPEAVEWLQKGKQLPVVSQDDKQSQTEMESLLAKYQR